MNIIELAMCVLAKMDKTSLHISHVTHADSRIIKSRLGLKQWVMRAEPCDRIFSANRCLPGVALTVLRVKEDVKQTVCTNTYNQGFQCSTIKHQSRNCCSSTSISAPYHNWEQCPTLQQVMHVGDVTNL